MTVRTHAIAAGFLAAMTLVVALPHLAGDFVFIGESDRLNTFLNLKLFEARSLQELGRVPAWNENALMGFSARGLYWMAPGLNPDAYLHASLPLEALFGNAALMTFALFLLTLGSTYAYLVHLTRNCVAAAVGACMYGCSTLALQRMAQGDPSYYIFALLPLGMLALRRVGEQAWRLEFLVLCFATYVMAGLGQLQEPAYALLLLGCYALFRAVRTRSPWPPAVFAAAAAIGLLAAGPRVVTVAQDFREMFRTSQLFATHPAQFLRVLNDGIFGRYWSEAWYVMGNSGYNFHEGLQTYSSTVGAGLVLLSVLLVDVRRHWAAIAAILGLLVLLAWQLHALAGILALGIGLALFAYESRRPEPSRLQTLEPSELSFHLVVVALGIAVVLIPAFRTGLHLAFFKVDFLHSRFTIVALLPLAAAAALLLSASRIPRRLSVWLCALGIAAGIALVHFAILDWESGLAAPERRLAYQRNAISIAVLLRTAVLLGLTCAAIVVLRRTSGTSAYRAMTLASLAAVIVLECALFARDRLMGEHTRTFPRPFAGGNYFSSPAGTFRSPDRDCRKILSDRLQNERYRSVVIAAHDKFSPLTAPHVAQFWDIRLLDGYPSLPVRLAELPWPTGITNLRSIEFRYPEQMPWALLALLNVKNAVILDEALYYNMSAGAPGARCPSLQGLKVLENPHPVLPRHYFAARAVPAGSSVALRPIENFQAHRLPEGSVELTWWAQTSDGNVQIQARRKGESEFRTIARYSPLGNKHHIFAAPRALEHEFRARKLRRGAAAFETASVEPLRDAAPEEARCRSGREAACTPAAQLYAKAFAADPLKDAMVEGIDVAADYSTAGEIRARYAGDYLSFDFEPSARPRFLVVNELYHPRWRAHVDGREQRILPTNKVMRGIEIPPGASRLELRFQPFVSSAAAWLVLAAAAMGFAAFLLFGHRAIRRLATTTSGN